MPAQRRRAGAVRKVPLEGGAFTKKKQKNKPGNRERRPEAGVGSVLKEAGPQRRG